MEIPILVWGRLTLINVVLDALPTYMLTLFPIQPGAVQRLDQIRRSFFWQGNNTKKGYHLVKWKELISSKKQGGLGIKNLKNQSKALKMKWLWRYTHETHSLWKRVITSKYGELDGWMTEEANNPYGSLFGDLSETSGLFYDRTIADMWALQGWDLNFRRNLNDWEIPRLIEFFKILEAFQGLKNGVDRLWWNGHNKGAYKVSSGYKLLNSTVAQNSIWPWKQIWRTKAPLKVACFSWLLAKEVVLTHENLRKRNIILVMHCCLCGEAAETVGHLFLHCRITDQLWKIFINYNGQCLARLLTLYLVGKKLGREQKTGATRESYHFVYGGPSGRREMLGVSKIGVEQYKKSKQIVFCFCVFGVQGTPL
ncbi:hypothetical protein MTR67_018081 [Solanum verrucosum]|uniref:Reverse transcriptase zinc-binding domain-containing protein n=1 Tax=Solanum verrucosum TaxID=315347 RepID=A0AAF0TM27_SOLVR|nr:hypothetical protein MTR67_018081 [Solanum verrucosum]